PSHHRVHHGRDPKYIDKNHAGSLIIWDRMFGTFQKEEEKPTYGITRPLNSWNPIYANVSHYIQMKDDLLRIPKWSDRIRYLFKKPGWLPDYLGGYRPAPPVDKATYRKYAPQSTMLLNTYVLFQYLICLGGTSFFLFNASKLNTGAQVFISILISVMVVNCGVLFEQRPWVRWSEWVRIFLYPLLLSVFTYINGWPSMWHGVAVLYCVISFAWFFQVQKKYEHLQIA